jgi:ABC-type nitrate/sulfonate/bicarbonate transport system ATPase subunit
VTGLSIKNLDFAYDDQIILEKFSLEVAGGEMVALLGPSGCGKTTLLRTIAGLETPRGGEIAVGGGIQNKISYVFQDYDAFPWFTVRKNLSLIPGTDANRIRSVATGIGIGEVLDRFPQQISGGQRKRIALARILLEESSVVLLDEPFSSLDVRNKMQVYELLSAMRRRTEMACILVAHSIDEVMATADRVVITDGPPLQVKGTVKMLGSVANKVAVADEIYRLIAR